jgi:hypothetical protein
LGIIGGLIMFYVIKDEDRNMAKKSLILGIILIAVGFVLSFVTFLRFAAGTATATADYDFGT